MTDEVKPPDTKDQMSEQSRGRVRHCGSSLDLEMAHIMPFSEGGKGATENLRFEGVTVLHHTGRPEHRKDLAFHERDRIGGFTF
jgi:hypothetical protein